MSQDIGSIPNIVILGLSGCWGSIFIPNDILIMFKSVDAPYGISVIILNRSSVY